MTIGRPFMPGDTRINKGGQTRELRARISAVRDAALEHAPKALARLAELLDSPDGKVVAAAASAILDRAVGRPSAALPTDDRIAKLAESELKGRVDLAQARCREIELTDEVEALRQRVAELAESVRGVQ